MANLDLARGRSTVLNLTNQTGSTRSPGDVVVLSTANDESFTTSASSNYATTQIGVVDETIGIGSNGRVVVEGYARNVNVGVNTVSRGHWLYQSTSAGIGVGSAINPPIAGAFGQVLKGGTGTEPSAVIIPVIQSSGGGSSVSAGSNSTRVSETSAAGVAATFSPSDHRHDGIGTITASSSNTMQRGTWNLRPGAGIALSLSDTDGDGEFDTTTIVNTGSGGGGSGITVADEGTPLSALATTLDFVGAGVTASGTGATKTITISGGGGSAIPVPTNYHYAQGNGSISITLGFTPTNGRDLFLSLRAYSAGASAITQTNVTWTQILTVNSGGNIYLELWRGAVAASPGTGITVTGPASFYEVAVDEFSGLTYSAGTPVTRNTASAGVGAAIALVPTAAGKLCWGGFATNNDSSDDGVLKVDPGPVMLAGGGISTFPNGANARPMGFGYFLAHSTARHIVHTTNRYTPAGNTPFAIAAVQLT